MDSLRKGQLDYLDGARQKGPAPILSELKEIAKASNSRWKYFHLIRGLSDMGLLVMPAKLNKIMSCRATTGWGGLIDEIEICVPPDSKIDVVFVQPRRGNVERSYGFQHIGFGEFACIIAGSGELGSLLARYLRIWREDPAKPPSGDV